MENDLNLDKFEAMVRSLRTCANPRDCGDCPYWARFGAQGCDRLEADAADAIQNLLEVIDTGKTLLPSTEPLPAVDAVNASCATKEAVKLILEERRRQVEQWGDQVSNHPYEWMSILGEEFGELCRAVNETCFQNPKEPELGGNDNIISEAVQVATVAIAIIEACLGQRREDGDA